MSFETRKQINHLANSRKIQNILRDPAPTIPPFCAILRDAGFCEINPAGSRPAKIFEKNPAKSFVFCGSSQDELVAF